MPSPGSRRWLRRGLVAVACLAVGLGGAAAVVLLHAPGNVSHPNVEFTVPTTTTAAARPQRHDAVADNFAWPLFGYDAARTRFFPNGQKLDPPFRVGWTYNDGALLEFSPVIYQHTLYFMDFDGSVKAVSSLNGHVLWQRKVGTLAAASPALDIPHQLLFVPLLSTTPGARLPGNGRFVALSMKTGQVIWSHAIPPGSESSPLVHGLSVFFGDQGGTVYSFRTYDGHLNWTYHASGAVKGGVAFADGAIYFGDYAGRAYALNPATGQQRWAVNTDGADFGFGSGTFYSTPAVAFGRVYMGNTDGFVYSFAQRNGQLAWATSTGAYVYSSAAVANVPGVGPTVYVGSYDGDFYAFNARSGAVRWTHPAGGRISGSPTIVGNVVYFAALGTKATTGLDLQTGQKVFSFPDGLFTPVVCDDSAIYLTGYSTIYQMLPAHPQRATQTISARKQSPSRSGRKRSTVSA